MFRQERIAKAIAASGKQKQQIATECGVSNASVSQRISGESKSMKPENLYALAWPDKSSNQSRSHKPAMCGFFVPAYQAICTLPKYFFRHDLTGGLGSLKFTPAPPETTARPKGQLFNNLEPSAVPTASAERRKQNRLLSRENPTMCGYGTTPDRRADASGVSAHRYAPNPLPAGCLRRRRTTSTAAK